MRVSLFFFFEKLVSFLIELLVLASLPNHSMGNIRSISLSVCLKIFWNSRNASRKRPTVRSKRSQVLYKIGILKKSAIPKKTTVLESLFKKVCRNKETPAQVFSWEYCETLKNTFFTEHLRSDGVGVCL